MTEEESESHQQCTEAGRHICAWPSGRRCLECGEPAGTWWGPYWCPPCDKVRLDRISKSLEDILKSFSKE